MAGTILIIGNSHVFAMQAAIKDRRYPERYRAMRWDNKHADGKERFPDAEIGDAVEALTSDDMLAIIPFGNRHHLFGLFEATPPISVGAAIDGHDMIPTNVMRAVLAPSDTEQARVKAMIQRAKCKVVMISAPPVKADNEYIASHTDSKLGTSVRDLPLAKPELRRQLRELENAWLRDYCADLGIDFVDAPLKAFTADGFLIPKFYSADATHANHRYGWYMLDRLRKWPR